MGICVRKQCNKALELLFFFYLRVKQKALQLSFYCFLLFPSCLLFWADWQKFLPMNYLLLPRASVTRSDMLPCAHRQMFLFYFCICSISVLTRVVSTFFICVWNPRHTQELFSMLYQLNSCDQKFSLLGELCRCQKPFITSVVTIANISISCNYCKDYLQLFHKYIYFYVLLCIYVPRQLFLQLVRLMRQIQQETNK